MVRKIRNSFAAKKSRAEILNGFQKRGYKLAYAEELIKKANRPRKFLAIFTVCFIVFFSVGTMFYTISYESTKTKLSNPLSGFVIAKNNPTKIVFHQTRTGTTTYDKIKITPDIVSYLLNEIGAWQLHENPLTLENPIINIKIGNESFHSEIGDKIETKKGFGNDADLEFYVDKKDLVDAIISNNPEAVFRKDVLTGKVKVKPMTNKADLFAKGYFNLYKKLE